MRMLYPDVQGYSNETYEKLSSAFSSTRLVARERNKAWKEAKQNLISTEERVNDIEHELDEINTHLPQIVEEIKRSLQSVTDNNESILKQFEDQLKEKDSELEELGSKIELEEQQKKTYQDQIDDIGNNREQLCDCASVPGVSMLIRKVIMERERESISRYHQAERELGNTAVFRVGKRRELSELINRINNQYSRSVTQFLDAQIHELRIKLQNCDGRITEYKSQIEEYYKAREKLIARKQAKEFVSKTVDHAYEELNNYPYRDFTEVFSLEEREIVAPLFYELNVTIKSLLEHETRLKAAKDRLTRTKIATEALENETFTDNDIMELDQCKKIIDQVSFSNLSRNVLFRKLLSVYQQYNQEYIRYNYRHKLYLRLLMCSLYYPRGVSSDRFINIDEAQDLSVAEYQLLKNILGPRCIFNLYGDINQNVYSYKGISNWADINFITDRVYELNENYRNTLQITKFCNEEFGSSVYPIGISGKDVAELDLRSAIDSIVSEKKKQKNCRCAILYRYGVQAIRESLKLLLDENLVSWSSVDEEHICVLSVEQAKGLEFDIVVAITDQMTENEKYIAYTRALDSLIVVRETFERKIEAELSDLEDTILEDEINLEDETDIYVEQIDNNDEGNNSSLADKDSIIAVSEIQDENDSDVSEVDSSDNGAISDMMPQVDFDLQIIGEIETSLSEKFREGVALTKAQRIIATLLSSHENVIYIAPAGNRKSLLLNWFAYKTHHEINKQTIISADSYMQENLLVLAEQIGLRAGVILDMDSFQADFSKEKYDIIFAPLDFFDDRTNVDKFIKYFTGRVSYWGIDNPSMENSDLKSLIEYGATIGSAMYIMQKPGNAIPNFKGFAVVGVTGTDYSVPIKKINLISVEDKKKWIIENTHLLVNQGIIYCNEEDDCASICKALRKKKVKAEAYIQIDQEENAERINYLTATFTQGGLPIIATTHEAGKNLTNPNLRFIIHYDMPEKNTYDLHVGQLAYSTDSVVYDLMVSETHDKKSDDKVINYLDLANENNAVLSENDDSISEPGLE